MARPKSIGVLIVAFASLVACATSPGTSTSTGGPSSSVSGAVDEGGVSEGSCTALPTPSQMPSFSGPWAPEFERRYLEASAQIERDILSDGVITTAEMSEVTSQYTQCLVNLGFTDVHWNFDGSGQLTPPAGLPDDPRAAQDLMQPCDCSTGWPYLAGMYTSIGQNPDNIDSVVLMVQCLVRVGLEPASYTSQQYLNDLNGGYFETLKTDDYTKYRACNADPAHAK